MTTRAEIAVALTSVNGVKGYLYRPTTAKPGDAWPLLVSYDRADGFAFYVSWRVQIMLPADARAASDWIDQHVEALVTALQPVMYVDRLEPVGINADGSGQPFLEVSGRSE